MPEWEHANPANFKVNYAKSNVTHFVILDISARHVVHTLYVSNAGDGTARKKHFSISTVLFFFVVTLNSHSLFYF